MLGLTPNVVQKIELGQVFKMTLAEDGCGCAECLTKNIFTLGDTWGNVPQKVLAAVPGFFFDHPQTPHPRLNQMLGENLAEA